MFQKMAVIFINVCKFTSFQFSQKAILGAMGSTNVHYTVLFCDGESWARIHFACSSIIDLIHCTFVPKQTV